MPVHLLTASFRKGAKSKCPCCDNPSENCEAGPGRDRDGNLINGRGAEWLKRGSEGQQDRRKAKELEAKLRKAQLTASASLKLGPVVMVASGEKRKAAVGLTRQESPSKKKQRKD